MPIRLCIHCRCQATVRLFTVLDFPIGSCSANWLFVAWQLGEELVCPSPLADQVLRRGAFRGILGGAATVIPGGPGKPDSEGLWRLPSVPGPPASLMGPVPPAGVVVF